MSEARASVTAHMGEHLEQATAVRDAVQMGRLSAARSPASELAHHWPDQVLVDWLPYVVGLRTAAGAVADAKDLAMACTATADVALACGRCHSALMQGPAFRVPPKPALADDMAGAMKRHRWGADRLWEGLVQARDEPWNDGLEALTDLPPCEENHGGEQLVGEISAARAQLDSLLPRAAEAKDLDARAAIYGEVLNACSRCHLAGC